MATKLPTAKPLLCPARPVESRDKWPGYKTARWQRARARFLRNPENVLCACGEYATVVHHIQEVRAGVDPWDESNWEGMCSRCHNQHHKSKRATSNTVISGAVTG